MYNEQVGAGLSWSYKEFNKIKILALFINNAIGNVYKDRKIIHEVFDFDTVQLNKNTTIIVVVTNLNLDINKLKQMNQQFYVTIGETIWPFYTVSTMDIENICNTIELIKFFVECSNVVKDTIHNSIL